MKYVSHSNEVLPFATDHGEIIQELIGRGAGNATSQRHSIALITMPPGKASLLHYHPQAEESYLILEGEGHLQLGQEEGEVAAGDAILIPATMHHKISNRGDQDLVFLAVCVPAWEANNSVYLEGPEAVK